MSSRAVPSMRRPRTAAITLLGTVFVGSAWPTLALAGQQACAYRGGHDFGTRSNIDATSDVTVLFASTAGSFVRVQDAASAPTGLYQLGHVKGDSVTYDDCGSGTWVGLLEEWKVASPTTPYHCARWFTNFGFSSNALLTVTRNPDTAGYWRIYRDGTYLTQKGSLGFSDAVSMACAEWQGLSVPSNFHARWGPPGITPWQYRAGSPTAAFADVPVAQYDGSSGFTRIGSPPRFSWNR